MNRLVFIVVSLAAVILPAGPAAAVADETEAAPPQQSARFAIIVGVNQSVDPDAHPLRYADDDAAAYLELFRALGARTYLLSRFDESTRRLHPQAVAEAYDPRRRELDRMVEQVSADVALARRRGVPTIVYFIYAGHGGVENGRGYLALEDARLYGADLEQLIVDRVGGAETHFIVDACYSAFLAVSRGPGGERQEARGFSTLGGLAARPGVGLLLSTSSARESHEWSEFQAGVFSHEVRSGLLGAADADGDGQISYREIAAFVDRANAPIPNERLRPDVYAKEPASARTLLDLRPGLARRLELDGQHPGHYFIEDARGVRLADFHNAPGQPLHLMRPVGDGPLYLRKLGEQAGGDLEYLMDAAPAVLRLEDLHPQPSTTAARGAAQDSFRLLFSLPFSQQVVDAFVERQPTLVASSVGDVPPASPRRRAIAVGLIAVGAAAAAGGTWAVLSALDAQRRTEPSQLGVHEANQLIDQRNDWARALFGISGAALATGTLLLLWPRLTGATQPPVVLGISRDARGATVLEWSGHF
ncbi:MAG TPA: hypothetical protein VLA79_20445 [Polyangia bacterium]|nr:hypothetical protein [Polyangia bacterium]